MNVTKTCPICKKEFAVPRWREKSAKTCSQTCRGVLIAQAYKAKRPVHRCQWCDKEFTSPPSQAKLRKHCSIKCADAAKVGNYAGQIASDGGTNMHSAGYVLERSRSHPFAVSGEVMQHRLVMERWMREAAPGHHFLVEIDGVKYLRREIHVHHRNEVKTDNKQSNLLACTAATHRDIHQGRPVMQGTSWPESGNEVQPVQRVFFNPCKICGTTVRTTLSNMNRGGGQFCSRKCRDVGAIGRKRQS